MLNAVRELPDDGRVILLVGHAPAPLGLVHELTDPAASHPEAIAVIENRFPAAGLAQLQFQGDLSKIDTGALGRVRLPASASP